MVIDDRPTVAEFQQLKREIVAKLRPILSQPHGFVGVDRVCEFCGEHYAAEHHWDSEGNPIRPALNNEA